jgi:HlyD family secretion protein
MKRVVAVVVVLAVVLVGLIAWKIRAQDEAQSGPASGSGVVDSEGIDLSARMSARVRRVHAEEGAEVAAGAVLYELECDEPEARLAEAEARLEAARSQAVGAHAQAEAADRQSSAARASIGAARAQIGVLDTQHDAAAREAARVESLGEHAALARVDQARSAQSGLEAQRQAARAAQIASSRSASASTSQARAALAQAEAADRNVAAVEALVRGARLAVAECRITAPRAGSIERLYYDPGELVLPGATVARLVDTSVVTATFYLPNADIDAARVGQRARVVADALPGQHFTAQISRIGSEAEFTPRNVQTRTDRDRLVYPIEVRIPNRNGLLRAGMPVTITLSGSS